MILGPIPVQDPPFALPPERKPEATFLGGAIGLDAEGMFVVGEDQLRFVSDFYADAVPSIVGVVTG